MTKNSRIYIAGHNGLVGSNLLKKLKQEGYKNIIIQDKYRMNLLHANTVNMFFEMKEPEYVFICAAHVGGIQENNTKSAEIIYNNTVMQSNLIKACHDYKVKKTLFLGSSCIYPGTFSNKITEDKLLSGKLENTNIGYAMAKINGIIMCQLFNKQYKDNFISAMPSNLYGPGDRYDFKRGHVLASLIMKIHDAKINKKKSITLWGNGRSLREFLYIDDLINALIFLMQKYDSPEIINVGTGNDVSITDLAYMIMEVMKYECKIVYDISKPNGTFRKTLDVSKINKLGWKAKTNLIIGLKQTVSNYIQLNHNGKAHETLS